MPRIYDLSIPEKVKKHFNVLERQFKKQYTKEEVQRKEKIGDEYYFQVDTEIFDGVPYTLVDFNRNIVDDNEENRRKYDYSAWLVLSKKEAENYSRRLVMNVKKEKTRQEENEVLYNEILNSNLRKGDNERLLKQMETL